MAEATESRVKEIITNELGVEPEKVTDDASFVEDLGADSLDTVELVLLMTVEPGFGGQSFHHDMLPKIETIRGWLDEQGSQVHLQVDGGIDSNTAPLVYQAGARNLVAGTSVFRNPSGVAAAIMSLRPKVSG